MPDTNLPESLSDTGVTISLASVIEEYRASSLRETEMLGYNLQDEFNHSVNQLATDIASIFYDYGSGAKYVDSFVADELYSFKADTLKSKMDKLLDTVNEAIASIRREVEEASEERLQPDEIRGRVLGIISKYNSFFEMPDAMWIEEATSEFSDHLMRKFPMTNEDMKYDLKRRIHKFSDILMNDYFDSVRGLQNDLTDNFVLATEQIELGLKQKEDTLDKSVDESLASTNEEIVKTEGKTQEELAAEKDEQLKKIMSDPSLSPEEKDAAYDKVAAKYDAAIAGLSTAPSNSQDLGSLFL